MKNHWMWISAGLISLSFCASVFAGGDSSGGGDLRPPEEGNAWFLGTKPVRYCIEMAPDFGVAPTVVEATVSKVLGTWKSYLDGMGNRPGFLEEPFLLFFNTERIQCDGAEDLKFMMGSQTPEVEKYRKAFYNPVAFARRTEYDTYSGRGKGFVWVASGSSLRPDAKFPDWSKRDHLYGMLLHEIGHVLGNDHVPYTIMREDIAELLLPGHTIEDYSQLSKIDGRRLLQFWSSSPMTSFEGIIDTGQLSTGNDQTAAATFEIFTGRAPVGKMRASLSSIQEAGVGSYLTINYQDDLGVTKIKIDSTQTMRGGTYNLPLSIFKVAYRTPGQSMESPPVVTTSSLFGGYFFAETHGADGQKYMVIIDMNMDMAPGPLYVRYITPGGMREMFVAIDYLGYDVENL